MTDRDGNLAFKCTYHNGGQQGYVGYSGTCSDANIIRNITRKKITWCSQEDNLCRQYLDNECQGARPQYPCYESKLLIDWEFGAGFYHRGPKKGQPIPLKGAQKGKVALLTTRLPASDREESRVVFAVAKIKSVDEKKARVIFDKESSLPIPKSIAERLPYWRFKEGEARWNTGLFRYWSDGEIADFLRALFVHLQSPSDRQIVEYLLHCVGDEPPALDNSLNDELDRVPPTVKYGPGGEGELHLRLKRYIAQHPHLLGLGPARRVLVEHSFATGDRVDVAIELADGTFTVVEVEVEGRTQTMIGAHQTLKYRALMAGQLDDGSVSHAFLVAYDIPESTREFCARHGVQVLELTPG